MYKKLLRFPIHCNTADRSAHTPVLHVGICLDMRVNRIVRRCQEQDAHTEALSQDSTFFSVSLFKYAIIIGFQAKHSSVLLSKTLYPEFHLGGGKAMHILQLRSLVFKLASIVHLLKPFYKRRNYCSHEGGNVSEKSYEKEKQEEGVYGNYNCLCRTFTFCIDLHIFYHLFWGLQSKLINIEALINSASH